MRPIVVYVPESPEVEEAAGWLAERTGTEAVALREEDSVHGIREHGRHRESDWHREGAADVEHCDTVYLGFPIREEHYPELVDSFIGSHDFDGRRVIPFVTGECEGVDACVADLRRRHVSVAFGHGVAVRTREDIAAVLVH